MFVAQSEVFWHVDPSYKGLGEGWNLIFRDDESYLELRSQPKTTRGTLLVLNKWARAHNVKVKMIDAYKIQTIFDKGTLESGIRIVIELLEPLPAGFDRHLSGKKTISKYPDENRQPR